MLPYSFLLSDVPTPHPHHTSRYSACSWTRWPSLLRNIASILMTGFTSCSYALYTDKAPTCSPLCTSNCSWSWSKYGEDTVPRIVHVISNWRETAQGEFGTLQDVNVHVPSYMYRTPHTFCCCDWTSSGNSKSISLFWDCNTVAFKLHVHVHVPYSVTFSRGLISAVFVV